MKALAGVGGGITASAALGFLWVKKVFGKIEVRPAPEGSANRRWVMVIDLAKCDGCRECTKACRAMHMAPPDQEWIRVYELDSEKSGKFWLPRPCLQCDNPPCVRVCPVSATFKREDGVVLIDENRCIGCRFCMAACPYSVRSFNWFEPPHKKEDLSKPYNKDYLPADEVLAKPYDMDMNMHHIKGVPTKCDFCTHLLRDGKLPPCADVCHMDAIYFGDQNQDVVMNRPGEKVELTTLLRDRAGYRLMEELGTSPRVYYLPPKEREYSSPEELSAKERQEMWEKFME
jgi:molybdopterin-containing oxidoreductase family iron-sulfur binding subunit